MRVLLLIPLLLTSCVRWREIQVRAWKKDGACSVVCDYRQGYLSAARTVSPYSCRCMTPTLRDLNAHRQVPLDEDVRTVHCLDGCVAEANAILQHQPWRRMYPDAFDDPIEELKR